MITSSTAPMAEVLKRSSRNKGGWSEKHGLEGLPNAVEDMRNTLLQFTRKVGSKKCGPSPACHQCRCNPSEPGLRKSVLSSRRC